MENLCSWKNRKRKEVLDKKERKRKQAQRKKKEYHSVKKRKNISLWKWLVQAELHAGVQISIKEVPVELKFAKHAVKNEVSFSLC